MAGKPQVTLTFAGDATKLTKAFEDVGASAKTLETDVGRSSKNIGDSSKEGFDKAGEAADNVDTKAMGFRDTITGVQDSMKGVGQIAKGDLAGGLLTLGMGIGDLASGFYNLIIPMAKTIVTTGAQTVATAAQTVASTAASVASKVWAAGQWVLNAALSANPIGLVVLAVVALIAIVVVIATKTTWFQKIFSGAWNGIKTAALAVGNWFKNTLWPWLKDVFDKVASAASSLKDKIVNAFNAVVGWLKGFPGKVKGYLDGAIAGGAKLLDWFKGLPGKIGGFFKGLGSTISKPFTAAFGAIRDFWNNTIGGKGFTIPDWVPKIGGKSFTIPRFHTGGIVPGGLGSESLALLKAGERVTAGSNSATPQQMGPIYLEAHIDLGDGVTKVVQVEMRKRDRNLKRTVKAA